MPFFITRQIFAGAGKIGIETEAGLATPGHYQLSQRADFFHVEASVDTMHNRPIVNTRDEPHADPAKYRRLHGIAGDANMSEYATALKMGTTALVIALIEQGKIPESLTLANPIDTIKTVSHDQTYRWIVITADGKTMSAIDHQREYLALAQRYLGESVLSEIDWVLAEWENTLNGLEKDPMALIDRLDWVAKNGYSKLLRRKKISIGTMLGSKVWIWNTITLTQTKDSTMGFQCDVLSQTSKLPRHFIIRLLARGHTSEDGRLIGSVLL